VTHRRSPDSGQ